MDDNGDQREKVASNGNRWSLVAMMVVLQLASIF
ncbi:unnamed protein product [Camellia sinensis]